jgi:hypothetical protein
MDLLAQHKQLLSVVVVVVVRVTLAGQVVIMVVLEVLRNLLQSFLLVEVLVVPKVALVLLLEVWVSKPMRETTIGLLVVLVLRVQLEQMQHDQEHLMAVFTVLQETELLPQLLVVV